MLSLCLASASTRRLISLWVGGSVARPLMVFSALAPRSRRSLLVAAILVLHAISLGISFAILVGEVVCLLLAAAGVRKSVVVASNARMLD